MIIIGQLININMEENINIMSRGTAFSISSPFNQLIRAGHDLSELKKVIRLFFH